MRRQRSEHLFLLPLCIFFSVLVSRGGSSFLIDLLVSVFSVLEYTNFPSLPYLAYLTYEAGARLVRLFQLA